ncbi:MAG: PilZ domain-containing protein [Desulfobacterales bacterium]|nr:MAG: PilZ domain-containing protein [Desulfobacterales bacterium]
MTKKTLVERRKHKRIQVRTGAFVGVGPHFNQVGPLIDISMGGLAFRYMAREKQPDGLSLDIFLTDRDFYLDYVPFTAVSDFKTPDTTTRRCSVQFGNLTQSQISCLEHFIAAYTSPSRPYRVPTASEKS